MKAKCLYAEVLRLLNADRDTDEHCTVDISTDSRSLPGLFSQRDAALKRATGDGFSEELCEQLVASALATTTLGSTIDQPIDQPPPIQKEVWISAYKYVHLCEPVLTNWTTSFEGTLDYVFFSPTDASQHVAAAVVLPNTPGPFPNHIWPSDHLCLVVSIVV